MWISPQTTLLLLLLSGCAVTAYSAANSISDLDLDDYGDEEPPVTERGKPFVPPTPTTPAPARNATSAPAFRRRPFTYTDYPLELAALAGLLLFVANIIRGSKENKAIAVAFAKATCHNNGIIVRNFSFIGPGAHLQLQSSCVACPRPYLHSLRAVGAQAETAQPSSPRKQQLATSCTHQDGGSATACVPL